jgi:hypothetical protein
MKRLLTLALAALLIGSATSCKKDDATASGTASVPAVSQLSGDIANRWFDLSLQMTRSTPGFSPPVSARTFGYLGLTLYESCVNGMPGYGSLQGKLNGLSAGAFPARPTGPVHYGLAANRAMSVALLAFYKSTSLANVEQLLALERSIREELSEGLSDEVVQNSVAYGDAVGSAVFAFARTDGQEGAMFSNFSPAFAVPVFAGAWQPTPPAFQPRPLQPYWGNVRTFLAQNVAVLPPPHPAYSTDPGSVFYAQSEEVYTTGKNLSAEQRQIAQFWSDDPVKTATPPGHSISILRQVLEREKSSLATAAEAYARLGMAQHDAFVSCWKCKYQYNLMRPITYIRAHMDASWNALLSTPPFPEYTSGHSVQSAAMAEVMSSLFGENYAFADRTHEARTDIDGTPRAFSSFRAAAQEAALSRLYGGIHYRFGIDAGLGMGEKIGKNIMALRFKS